MEDPSVNKNTLASNNKSNNKFTKNLLKNYLKAFNHFFGSFKSFFSVTDPREQDRVTYSLPSYLFLLSLMFLFRLGSVRQIKYLLNTQSGIENFHKLFGISKLPHNSSINKICRRLNPEEFQKLLTGMPRTLIRKRVLDKKRLFGKYYMIAIDGTWIYTFPERHCEHCLTKTSSKTGKTTYYHMVLEAKLVTRDGFSLSIMSEFVKNEQENPTKQDCEIKAFHRLAENLKKAFPRLPIILLLDGLFAEGPVFDRCKQNNWEYLVVLKDDDLKTVNTEFRNLKSLNTDNHVLLRKDGCIQNYDWCNSISYTDSKKREFELNVIECLEKTTKKETKYKTISSLRLNKKNVEKIIQAIRDRWVIENQGFNTQKNHGYNLKHQYSKDFAGMQVFYYLLQFADIWEQLVRKSNLITNTSLQAFGSIKNIYFCLLEEWRNYFLNYENINDIFNSRIQIRLDSG